MRDASSQAPRRPRSCKLSARVLPRRPSPGRKWAGPVTPFWRVLSVRFYRFILIDLLSGGEGWVGSFKRFYKRLLWRSFRSGGSGLCCVLSVCLRVEYLWLMPSCRIANIVWVDTKCYNHLYFRCKRCSFLKLYFTNVSWEFFLVKIFDSIIKYLEEQTKHNNFVNLTKCSLICDGYILNQPIKKKQNHISVRSAAKKWHKVVWYFFYHSVEMVATKDFVAKIINIRHELNSILFRH